MKKLITQLAVVALLVAACNASAITLTLNVLGGTYTNLLTVNNGSARITQITATAGSTTNSTVLFIDAPTNTLTYVTPGYTNISSYGTNYPVTWTNYYGVVQSYTNIALLHLTNAVAQTTNSWPQRLSIGALAGTSTVYSGVNYYFNDGVYVTNTSGGPMSITVTYQQ
jgi:hypothetical protein